MDPCCFHQLAQTLLKANGPAELRTAISRAYYAVYHVAVAELEKLGFRIPKGPQGHANVQRRLFGSGDLVTEKAGPKLQTLYTRRLHADYQLDRSDVENSRLAQALVEQADRLIHDIRQSVSDPGKRVKIIDAIKAYDQKVPPG